MSVERGIAVFAVVVSFNGGSKTIETIQALLTQVAHVHVVDNGSQEESIRRLRELAETPALSMAFLGQNFGIAAALNAGIRVARQLGYEWVLTMDQDSIIAPGMIAAFAAVLAKRPDAACLVPNVLMNGQHGSAVDGPVEFAITSGTLVRIGLLDEVGPFEEQLFIDGVDLDFSLRVRRMGHEILRVREAHLVHELGEHGNLRGWVGRVYASHSPLRRYYMYRNHLYLMKTYWRDFPGFILKATAYQILLLALVPFYDHEPGRSLRYIFKGICDFFGGKMGAIREVT